MAIHGKYLYTINVSGLYNNDIGLSVFGVFSTQKVHWDYYVISHYNKTNGAVIYLSDDVGTAPYSGNEASVDNVRKYGKPVTNIEEGQKFCDEFKMKWDSGLNNTTSEIRDKKLDEILNKK